MFGLVGLGLNLLFWLAQLLLERRDEKRGRIPSFSSPFTLAGRRFLHRRDYLVIVYGDSVGLSGLNWATASAVARNGFFDWVWVPVMVGIVASVGFVLAFRNAEDWSFYNGVTLTGWIHTVYWGMNFFSGTVLLFYLATGRMTILEIVIGGIGFAIWGAFNARDLVRWRER